MFEHERSTKSLAGRWARALGISTDRLATIVREVVEERQAPRDTLAAAAPAGRAADRIGANLAWLGNAGTDCLVILLPAVTDPVPPQSPFTAGKPRR